MVSFMGLLAGGFGDEHRAQREELLAGQLVEQQNSIVHRLGGDRAGRVAFGKFLANRFVMPEEIFAVAAGLAPASLKPSHTDGINLKP